MSSARGGPRVRNIHADAQSLTSRGEPRHHRRLGGASSSPRATPDYHETRIVVDRRRFDNDGFLWFLLR